MKKHLSDEQLVERIHKGQKGAFDLLYARYEVSLFKFINSYLRNKELSEEVFQDTMISAISNVKVNHDMNFRGWIYKIARNKCTDLVRKQEAFNRAAIKLETEASVMESEPNTEIYLEELKAASHQLTPALRELFELKMRGLKNSEIAEIMNVPIGTIKSRTAQMITILKKDINKNV